MLADDVLVAGVVGDITPSARDDAPLARALGTVLAFELNIGKDEYINTTGPAITRDALEAGIYLRPLGNTVYLMPPYCITEKEMDQVYNFLIHCIRRYSEPLDLHRH